MGLLPFRRQNVLTSTAEAECNGKPFMKPLKYRYLLVLGLIVLLALVTACAPDAPQSMFSSAGPVAESQLAIFNVLLWVMVVVFVLVEGILLYAIIRFRRRPGQPLPHQTHGNTTLEIVWTIIPTIMILGLGIWSVMTLVDLEEPSAEAGNALEIIATGHQWWFEFEYSDADGQGKKITTANELRVPIDRPVRVSLQSDDVIHSFWIPKLAGKVDMVPTRNNKLWFQGAEIGMFYGQCAEFCGISHALMKFRVHVLTDDDYSAWVQAYGQTPDLSAAAQQGQQVFQSTGGCLVCHTTSGYDEPATVAGRMSGYLAGGPHAPGPIFPGPNLTDLGTRQTLAAGIMELNGENLRQWLRNPDEVKPGNHMAELASVYQTPNGEVSLSPEEVTNLIEYLLSLK